jgi:DNA-directed RNA polymerase alpha subunit
MQEIVIRRKKLLLSINGIDIPVRVKNILNAAGIRNVGELHKLSIIQLLCLYGIGRIAVEQLNTALNSLGLRLKHGSFRYFRKYMDFWKKRDARID